MINKLPNSYENLPIWKSYAMWKNTCFHENCHYVYHNYDYRLPRMKKLVSHFLQKLYELSSEVHIKLDHVMHACSYFVINALIR